MKALVVLILAAAIFSTAGYYSWLIFWKPKQELVEERKQPATPPPQDPALPEYEKCVAILKQRRLPEARAAFADFIERYPDSTKIEDARERLGQVNVALYFSPAPAPEKQEYLVQRGDVINKVAARMKTTPELIMRANGIEGSMLRIGQKLVIVPATFLCSINRKSRKVVVLNNGKFFTQYPIRSMPVQAAKKGATPKPGKITGRVMEKIAWYNGQRVTPFDKDKGQAHAAADHWIVISPPGHSLYAESQGGADAASSKPPGGGYVLAPQHVRDLAAMLRKSSAVTIE